MTLNTAGSDEPEHQDVWNGSCCNQTITLKIPPAGPLSAMGIYRKLIPLVGSENGSSLTAVLRNPNLGIAS